VIKSPWPDITGPYIRLVKEKKGEGWEFYEEEFNLLRMDPQAKKILYWRGPGGTYCGNINNYRENLTRWEGYGTGSVCSQNNIEVSEQPSGVLRDKDTREQVYGWATGHNRNTEWTNLRLRSQTSW